MEHCNMMSLTLLMPLTLEGVERGQIESLHLVLWEISTQISTTFVPFAFPITMQEDKDKELNQPKP